MERTKHRNPRPNSCPLLGPCNNTLRRPTVIVAGLRDFMGFCSKIMISLIKGRTLRTISTNKKTNETSKISVPLSPNGTPRSNNNYRSQIAMAPRTNSWQKRILGSNLTTSLMTPPILGRSRNTDFPRYAVAKTDLNKNQ